MGEFRESGATAGASFKAPTSKASRAKSSDCTVLAPVVENAHAEEDADVDLAVSILDVDPGAEEEGENPYAVDEESSSMLRQLDERLRSLGKEWEAQPPLIALPALRSASALQAMVPRTEGADPQDVCARYESSDAERAMLAIDNHVLEL